METVVLVIHLLLALALIGVVLLQRSEGGGLGMGSAGGVMTGRGAATALGKITWGLAGAFIVTSLTLTILAAWEGGSGSVVDRVTDAPATIPDAALPDLGGGSLLPPTDGAPLVPAPATPATEVPAAAAETAPAPETVPDEAAEPAPDAAPAGGN